MKIIKPSYEICNHSSDIGKYVMHNLASYGRTCYKSDKKSTEEENQKFIEMIMSKGHLSVIEHMVMTVRIICDRGISHEIVRHRLGSYSQESTRYCNYSKDKFGREITVIKPPFFREDSASYMPWYNACLVAEEYYFHLINLGAKPQEARSILPNSLKTEIVVTYNLREWRHFFKLRTSKAAHPQMREIATPLLQDFQELIPVIFDDITGYTWNV